MQLLAAGVSLNAVRHVFITHHHSDHNFEYGALLYNAWITGLPFRLDAYGPPGLERMTSSFFEYMKDDLDTRVPDEGRSDPRGLVAAHEFLAPGVVLQNDEVTVRSCSVRHPAIQHAYAYRFDAKDRSVVISGDTAYAPELAAFARGADVLVHEVMYPPGIERLLARLPNAHRLRAHLLASHTVPEDVGRIAAEAGVVHWCCPLRSGRRRDDHGCPVVEGRARALQGPGDRRHRFDEDLARHGPTARRARP